MSGTLAEFPSWEGSGVGRFMESLLLVCTAWAGPVAWTINPGITPEHTIQGLISR